MTKDFGDRENTRVRDLADLMLFREHGLLDPHTLASAVTTVWSERYGTRPPAELPALPASWRRRYEQLAADYALQPSSFPAAEELAAELWAQMFHAEGS